MRSNAIQTVFQTVRGYYSNLFTGLHCYNTTLVKSDLMNHLKYDERILNRSGFFHTTFKPTFEVKIMQRSQKNIGRRHIEYLI